MYGKYQKTKCEKTRFRKRRVLCRQENVRTNTESAQCHHFFRVSLLGGGKYADNIKSGGWQDLELADDSAVIVLNVSCLLATEQLERVKQLAEPVKLTLWLQLIGEDLHTTQHSKTSLSRETINHTTVVFYTEHAYHCRPTSNGPIPWRPQTMTTTATAKKT